MRALMRRQDFNFDLPAELIAQAPLAQRSASRLLHLAADPAEVVDLQFSQLPQLLAPNDLLVFNDTRVVAARIFGTKDTGGKAEIFLERPLSERRAWVQLRASKSPQLGSQIATAGGMLKVIARAGEWWEIETPIEVFAFFEAHGHVPLPPYINRTATRDDLERYQSLFAREKGAVAAPTASLHFDAELITALDARGIARATVTLHVGAGTFAPLRVENIAEHRMHAERYSIGAPLVEAVRACRQRGGRVVAVGTTVARALESAYAASPSEVLRIGADETRLFITPGYAFGIVDALITNFHLPESTLLMLVSAFAGRERVLAAYEHAVRQRYRFFSYGDAMFLTRQKGLA